MDRDRRRLIRIVVTILLAGWFGQTLPARAMWVQASQGPAEPVKIEFVPKPYETLVQETLDLIGWPRSLRYRFLITWPAERLSRLAVWLELGFRIDGAWQSEELTLVLGVLDAFGATYGESRFAEVARDAVIAGSGGRSEHIWLVKTSGESISVAAWLPDLGRMEINERLFDDDVLAAHYNWGFLTGPYVQANPDIDLRRVIVAHEFGHIVIHGLYAEARASGHSGLLPEYLYSSSVSVAQRPHGYGGTNESLATEIGVWALGISRTSEIKAFRDAFLNETVDGRGWPEATASRFALASAYGAR